MNLEKYIRQKIKILYIRGEYNPDNDYINILAIAKEYDTDDFTETEIENLNNILTGTSENYTFIDEYSKNNYPEVLKELLEIIENSNGEYYFCDNFRISNGNKVDELIYETQRISGCCGFYDNTIEVNGVTYKVGFNYGH